MVHLQGFHEEYGDRGLFVYAITMHPDAELARRRGAEMGITYPVFDGRGSALGEQYAYG